MLYHIQPVIAQVQSAAFQAGHAEGLANQDWKKNLKEDEPLMNKVCHTWWFGMGVKDQIKRK